MDLRQLRYFKMVADERNFTRAAQRLHIAQPPLSRQIQQLEAELGTSLFDREARPLGLTPTGRLFYDQANQVLSRVEDMRSMITRAIATQQHNFAIGFVASTMYARLPDLIREFRKVAPEVNLSLVEMGSIEQITALKEGLIDVGFGRIRFDDPAVRRTILRNERLVVAVPMDHPFTQETAPIPLSRIATQPQILYPRAPRPSYADQVLSLFHDNGLEPTIAHEVRELQIAVGMVAAEEGVCIVPESVHQSRTVDVCYLPITEALSSPVIMSHRVNDISQELAIMAAVIATTYGRWDYPVPDTITEMAERSGLI